MLDNPTRVVNLHVEQYDVYIGRPGHNLDGYFGNPVRLGQKCPVCRGVHKHRGGTLLCFEDYARQRLAVDTTYRARVKALFGKRLGCFCRPSACHGDVLATLAAELIR